MKEASWKRFVQVFDEQLKETIKHRALSRTRMSSSAQIPANSCLVTKAPPSINNNHFKLKPTPKGKNFH